MRRKPNYYIIKNITKQWLKCLTWRCMRLKQPIALLFNWKRLQNGFLNDFLLLERSDQSKKPDFFHAQVSPYLCNFKKSKIAPRIVCQKLYCFFWIVNIGFITLVLLLSWGLTENLKNKLKSSHMDFLLKCCLIHWPYEAHFKKMVYDSYKSCQNIPLTGNFYSILFSAYNVINVDNMETL